jgi:hypothetical protein
MSPKQKKVQRIKPLLDGLGVIRKAAKILPNDELKADLVSAVCRAFRF